MLKDVSAKYKKALYSYNQSIFYILMSLHLFFKYTVG